MSGIIYTNAPASQGSGERQPAVAAVDAYWLQGLNRFPAPLALDGVPAQGGAWRRRGSEPDPTTFEIHDPAPHRPRAELILAVHLVSGGTLLTGLAGFDEAITGHIKQLRAYFDDRSWAYLLESSRGITMNVISNVRDLRRRRFDVVSVAGVPYATDTLHYSLFNGFSVGGEGLRVFQDPFGRTNYIVGVTDDYKEYGPGALAMALSDYERIGPMLAPHPSGPHLRWEAVVKPVYDPNELAFLRAFVREDLDTYEIVLNGRGEDR